MTTGFTFHTGEATVFAKEGQATDAMPEILIGRTDGPVGYAFGNLMAQSKGHNYEATKLAIRRALNNEPSIDELIANREAIRHDMNDWD